MPICINVADLHPGMKLFQAVCNDYVVLLPPGKVLDQRDVDALRRKFPKLQVMISDPLLDSFCDFQDSTKDRETAREVQQTMSKSMGSVRRKLIGRTDIRSQDILSLQRAAVEMMHYLQDNPVTAVFLARANDSDAYLQEHSANVFYISMVVGNAIKQYIIEERERLSKANRLERAYALNLTPLAMGCLLHDIGMLDLQDIYDSVGELTSEQRVRLENHPVVGAKMLPANLSAVARMVVRTHHENFNGSGYPNKLSRDKLHVFSRIIRVADAFDAATSPRIYKKAKSEVRVLWEMTAGPMRENYDPVIAKVFSHMVHPFPIGAKLLLSNGQYGVVVRQNVNSSFHPHVVVAFDKHGNRLPKERLKPPANLLQCKDLWIVSFNGEDLTYLSNTAAAVGQDDKAPAGEAFSYAYP